MARNTAPISKALWVLLGVLGTTAAAICLLAAMKYHEFSVEFRKMEDESATCQLCNKPENDCLAACSPTGQAARLAICGIRGLPQTVTDCLNADVSVKATAKDEAGAKLKACIAKTGQDQKNFVDLIEKRTAVTDQDRDDWKQKCKISSADDLILAGRITGLPNNTEAKLQVMDCPPETTTNGQFHVPVFQRCNIGLIPLSIRVPGYDEDCSEIIPSDKYKAHPWLDLKLKCKKNSTSDIVNDTKIAPPPTPCSDGNIVDWINYPIQPIGDCPEPSKIQEDARGNILAEPAYRDVNMRPTLYGNANNGNAISHEVGEASTFYRVRASEPCYLKGGYTHGGFYYNIDKAKTPEHRKYKISFCAWSVNADGLALRIQHSDGHGEVSNLSRTAIITRERKRFEWPGNLSGYIDENQQNVPHRYLFGYLSDFRGKRACDPDPEHQEKFAGKEFVIGDVRLEMLPE